MSYNYYFDFFKPGKKFFSEQEIEKLTHDLQGMNFDVSSGYPELSDYYRKDGKIVLHHKNTSAMIEVSQISEPYLSFNLFLDISDEEDEKEKNTIGHLSIVEEQIGEDEDGNELPKSVISSNCQIFYKAASAISFALKPYFVWGSHEYEFTDKIMDNLSFDKVGALVWMNMFSFEFVEKLGGLDKVLLLPNPEVEKIYAESKKTGKYMFVPLQLSENPLEDIPDEIREKCEEKFPGVILR